MWLLSVVKVVVVVAVVEIVVVGIAVREELATTRVVESSLFVAVLVKTASSGLSYKTGFHPINKSSKVMMAAKNVRRFLVLEIILDNPKFGPTRSTVLPLLRRKHQHDRL